MSMQDKRNKRNTLSKQLHALVNDHPKDQEWTGDHETKYNNIVQEIEKIDAELTREQKTLDLMAASAASNQRIADEQGVSIDEVEHNKTKAKAAFENYLRGGVNALTDEERQMLANQTNHVQNTMSTDVGSEGGYLTQEELAPDIASAMKAYGGMRQLARVVPTATGTEIPWPTSDATSERGEWLGQNNQTGDEDTNFSVRRIATHMLSSKVVAIPFQLLQDSQFDIAGYVNEIIGMRLGRTSEDAFINGSGTEQPHGLLADINAGFVASSGKTESCEYGDLIKLQHSVDPAYRNNERCSFMFHDKTLEVIREFKDSQNRPIWLPGLQAGDPNTILGKPYAVNQSMPQMAANAKSIAFGDFSKYIIRDVTQMMMFRFTDSNYTRKGQVGFLAMVRTGGRYIDVGGAIKYLQNSAS